MTWRFYFFFIFKLKKFKKLIKNKWRKAKGSSLSTFQQVTSCNRELGNVIFDCLQALSNKIFFRLATLPITLQIFETAWEKRAFFTINQQFFISSMTPILLKPVECNIFLSFHFFNFILNFICQYFKFFLKQQISWWLILLF